MKAQKFEINFFTQNQVNQSLLDSIYSKSLQLSKNEIYKLADSISNEISLKGFINNHYSLEETDTLINCTFSFNKKFDKIRVYYNKNILDDDFISTISSNYSDNYFEVSTFRIQNSLNLIMEHFEFKGLTFSKVSLNNLIVKKDFIEANLYLEVSKKRTIDKIIIKGYKEFPRKYLDHYLDINSKNTIFNSNSLLKTQELINTIPFITQIKNPEVLFTKDSTTLYLYVKKKSTSSFDGIIGFSNDQKSNKIKVNGYLNLFLNNLFNKGEILRLNWQNSTDATNTLKLSLNIPYIFRSKFSTNGSFSIYKQDSSFTNINADITLNYSLNRNQKIGSFLRFENSSTLTPKDIETFKRFSKKFVGFSYTYFKPKIKNENYFNFELRYLLGKRKIYNTTNKQNKALFHFEYLLQLNQKNNVSIKNTSEIIKTSDLLENELYRIGGVNSVRGFNELSIPTSQHSITNLEYHYHINNTNYIYSISDIAFIKNDLLDSTQNLIGLGFGYNYQTKNSNISLGYVIGKINQQAFKLNNAKLHIKLSYFF